MQRSCEDSQKGRERKCERKSMRRAFPSFLSFGVDDEMIASEKGVCAMYVCKMTGRAGFLRLELTTLA